MKIVHHLNWTEKILNDMFIVESYIFHTTEKIKVSKDSSPEKKTSIWREIEHSVCNMFNKFLTTGKKKWNKSHPGTLPTGLTLIVCKLMEAIIRDNMGKFFEKKNNKLAGVPGIAMVEITLSMI